MKLDTITHLQAPSRSARIITIVVAIGWLTIGIREVLSPQGWDATYGAPLMGEDGLSFVQAVGARNIALSLIGLFAALTGMRAALASVFAGIALIAAMDFYIVSAAAGPSNAIKHAVFVLVMTGIALWVAYSRGPGK